MATLTFTQFLSSVTVHLQCISFVVDVHSLLCERSAHSLQMTVDKRY